jgi:hypothetical protein
MSCDLLDVNAIKNRDVPIELSASLSGGKSGLPPHRPLLEPGLRLLSHLGVLGRVRQFLVSPPDHNVRPLYMAPSFIGL